MTKPHKPPGAKHQLDGVDCGQERLNQSLMQQPQQRGDRLRLPLCWHDWPDPLPVVVLGLGVDRRHQP